MSRRPPPPPHPPSQHSAFGVQIEQVGAAGLGGTAERGRFQEEGDAEVGQGNIHCSPGRGGKAQRSPRRNATMQSRCALAAACRAKRGAVAGPPTVHQPILHGRLRWERGSGSRCTRRIGKRQPCAVACPAGHAPADSCEPRCVQHSAPARRGARPARAARAIRRPAHG
jgi:hypothetical protein